MSIDLELPNIGPEDVSGSVNLIEAIETVIDSLDTTNSAMVSQGDNGHLWKFQYGSVEVFVQLTGVSDDDVLTVWSRILSLPVANEAALTRKLLEMNWLSTFEARFAIADNQVIVMANRTVADISPGEISRAITVVAAIADDHDEALIAEFGSSN
ncbi:YbjN domain-containing protein [Alkalinema pantanalense CENA528]|uniref:YbjN domain-containing protein n=1 Tax=Alkalinema pantanalense TaxID=1620705 RepID=UPI003D6F8CFF